MSDFCKHFKDKRVTVLGLGLLGRGIGDTKFLAECGAKLTVTDLKSAEELSTAIDALEAYPDIEYVLGEHRLEDFRDADMVLKASGVPLDSPYVAEAEKNGIPVTMSGALFTKIAGIPTIGVTGTRGKSTVTHLIHHTLNRATKDGEVLLGGNIRGVSNLELLHKVTGDNLAVLELDSWQLQGFGAEKISPQIAVFTNFLSDHMNYYHGDEEAYFKDKAQIFLHQKAGDTFVTTPEVFKRAEAFAKEAGVTFPQEVELVDSSLVPKDWQLQIPGEHNRLNVALAIAALRATSLPDALIREGVESFSGVPGRLEFLREAGGVKIYNDNNATTPDATRAALNALGGDKNIILIAGGADKGLDMSALLSDIPKYTKQVELLAGSGTDTIKNTLPDARVHETLKEAVDAAMSEAKNGDIVLFSPAFASFGMFINEYDRNDQVVSIIESL